MGVVIQVSFGDAVASAWQDGSLAGLRGAVAHANLAKRALDEMRTTPGSGDTEHGELDRMSILGEQLSDSAEDEPRWLEFAGGARGQLSAALSELKAMTLKEDFL